MNINEKTELCMNAIFAMKASYSPYSHFAVGAALLCENGTVFVGCNIENAAYSPTVCAERVAVFKAVSEGIRDLKAIAIAGGKDGVISGITPPCGVCRQVLAEFATSEFKVLCVKNANGDFDEFTMGELLPRSFSL